MCQYHDLSRWFLYDLSTWCDDILFYFESRLQYIHNLKSSDYFKWYNFCSSFCSIIPRCCYTCALLKSNNLIWSKTEEYSFFCCSTKTTRWNQKHITTSLKQIFLSLSNEKTN
jgi:hypothetical protein